MDLFQTILQWLQDPATRKLIIAIQLPIVLGLVFQCYQAYKYNFREFKYIGIAWFINFLYLLTNLFLQGNSKDNYSILAVRTTLDLISTYFFFLAVLHNATNPFLQKLNKIPKIYFIFLFLSAALLNNLPQFHLVIGIFELNSVPQALINLIVLSMRGVIYKQILKKYHQKKWLYYAALVYALIQLLTILYIEIPTIEGLPSGKLNLLINNFRFLIGLISKTCVLFFLSWLLLNIVKFQSDEEKYRIVKLIKYSREILSITNAYKCSIETCKQEQNILISAFSECTNLVEIKLGYCAEYTSKNEMIAIVKSFGVPQGLEGIVYNKQDDITSQAITARDIVDVRSSKSVRIQNMLAYLPDELAILSKFGNMGAAVAVPVWITEQVLGVKLICKSAK